MEVDSSEDSEDSESSLSKSLSSSDSLPSKTELNEYGKSEVTLIRSKRLAIGSKTSQRKSHKPATSLKIYDAIDLICEHCQINYYTSDECSKIFVPGSEDFSKVYIDIHLQDHQFPGGWKLWLQNSIPLHLQDSRSMG
ncbi:hypothetical protein O181_058011 [Austropuccinia psidii MF-1]|uniref:Uncharacterized protein n=1 Tax=Austropuccinia psidii MF-1 TaxID=1389203 RepID=A0A9Q3E9E3_9BASI|nr:hypothetical protein [Austropuccinia psidii MF-1]